MKRKTTKILFLSLAALVILSMGFVLYKESNSNKVMSGTIPEKEKIVSIQNDRLVVVANKKQYTIVMIGVYTPDNAMADMTKYLKQYVGKTVYLEKDNTDTVNGIYPRFVWLTTPDESKLNDNCLNAIILKEGRAMVNAKHIKVDTKYSNVLTVLTEYAADTHIGIYATSK